MDALPASGTKLTHTSTTFRSTKPSKVLRLTKSRTHAWRLARTMNSTTYRLAGVSHALRTADLATVASMEWWCQLLSLATPLIPSTTFATHLARTASTTTQALYPACLVEMDALSVPTTTLSTKSLLLQLDSQSIQSTTFAILLAPGLNTMILANSRAWTVLKAAPHAHTRMDSCR